MTGANVPPWGIWGEQYMQREHEMNTWVSGQNGSRSDVRKLRFRSLGIQGIPCCASGDQHWLILEVRWAN